MSFILMKFSWLDPFSLLHVNFLHFLLTYFSGPLLSFLLHLISNFLGYWASWISSPSSSPFLPWWSDGSSIISCPSSPSSKRSPIMDVLVVLVPLLVPTGCLRTWRACLLSAATLNIFPSLLPDVKVACPSSCCCRCCFGCPRLIGSCWLQNFCLSSMNERVSVKRTYPAVKKRKIFLSTKIMLMVSTTS